MGVKNPQPNAAILSRQSVEQTIIEQASIKSKKRHSGADKQVSE